jgi:glycosyltransferase involved in cell wall biosynthesis
MITLAHHWLVGMRGGEKVLEQICRIFPDAEITTLVSSRSNLSSVLQKREIHNSFAQYLYGKKTYKYLLPLYPFLVGRINVGVEKDIVINSDASVFKGIKVGEGAIHVCYCHSPPRYLWDLQETYERHTTGIGTIGRTVFKLCVPYVREFDRKAAQRVTHFIANSRFVQKRIKEYYGRDSEVIYPPVEVDQFQWDRKRDNFYLLVSELTPYKRVDLAIEAFRELNLNLVIIGDGPEGEKLKKSASSNVIFLGRQPFSALKEHYETCKAFLYPQIEDFGITAVEAQAAGAPVIAFRAGGAMETVIDGQTGVFFDEQTPEALRNTIKKFENDVPLEARNCRKNALKYSPRRFRNEIISFLQRNIPDFIYE